MRPESKVWNQQMAEQQNTDTHAGQGFPFQGTRASKDKVDTPGLAFELSLLPTLRFPPLGLGHRLSPPQTAGHSPSRHAGHLPFIFHSGSLAQLTSLYQEFPESPKQN